MTNDGKCLLRRKREQKRCFSQAENKDGTQKTKSSAFKGEKHLLNLCFYRRLFTILKVKRNGMGVMTNGFKIYQQ